MAQPTMSVTEVKQATQAFRDELRAMVHSHFDKDSEALNASPLTYTAAMSTHVLDVAISLVMSVIASANMTQEQAEAAAQHFKNDAGHRLDTALSLYCAALLAQTSEEDTEA